MDGCAVKCLNCKISTDITGDTILSTIQALEVGLMSYHTCNPCLHNHDLQVQVNFPTNKGHVLKLVCHTCSKNERKFSKAVWTLDTPLALVNITTMRFHAAHEAHPFNILYTTRSGEILFELASPGIIPS